MSNDHLTVMIAANAVGEQAPPYILFPGENLSAIPREVLGKDHVWANFSEKGWMDIPCFQAWMLLFIDEIKRKKANENTCDYTLLMIDGHSSRMDSKIMFTAALNRIIVFMGPSQLTHAWQANDCGTNRKFKLLLAESIERHVTAKLAFSIPDVSLHIIKSLCHPDMAIAIRNSFRHVGVSPFDRGKISKMIAKEQPKVSLLDTDERLAIAVSLASDELAKLDNLSSEKRKRDEEQNQWKKRSKAFVDNSFAVVVTEPASISGLDAQTTLSELRKLPAESLRKKMLEIGFKKEEICKPGASSYCPMKELLSLAEIKLQKLREEQTM